jgi:MFS family permease
MTERGIGSAGTTDTGRTRRPETVADPRRAGWPQAVVLLVASCLSVLGAVLIAPVLPRISQAFSGVAGAAALVPMVLTAPALMIGLLAPVAGRIVDAMGRRRVLIGALIAYALFGTAPLWLGSLPLLVASRVGVGITEAAIMTCCTTLLGDYFTGRTRDRMFGLQTVVTALSATAFFGIGGALGESSWRTPFWLYASSLVLAVAVALVIWQPLEHQGLRSAESARAALPPIDWKAVTRPLAVTLFGGVVFYALIVELSYILDGLGVTSVATIGRASALASLATAVGAIAFPSLARSGTRRLLPSAFGLAGVGLLVVAFSGSVPGVLVGACITSFGTGLLLPTLLTWVQLGLDYAQRGRVTGTWTACFFLGQFVCPLLLLAIGSGLGGLTGALAVLGAAALVMTAYLVLPGFRVGAAVAR